MFGSEVFREELELSYTLLPRAHRSRRSTSTGVCRAAPVIFRRWEGNSRIPIRRMARPARPGIIWSGGREVVEGISSPSVGTKC